MIYKSEFGDIYYELIGHRGNPVVVLCHGVGMDHQTFKQQVHALEKKAGQCCRKQGYDHPLWNE